MRHTVQQADVVGLWHRGLLRLPGREDDRTTQVAWLQGPRHYVDLRQDHASRAAHRRRPTCLADLDLDDLVALAGQEGFAGEFTVAEGVGTWRRAIDLQPPAPLPDEGRLEAFPRAQDEPSAADLLVEVGVHARYLEHWWREEQRPAHALCAAGVEESSGLPVVVVATGANVGLARGRTVPLPPDGDLRAAVLSAATVADARPLVDCELSIGVRGPQGWLIRRSSLPWRELTAVRPRLRGDLLELIDPEGREPTRRWRLSLLEGEESLLAADAPPAPYAVGSASPSRPSPVPER